MFISILFIHTLLISNLNFKMPKLSDILLKILSEKLSKILKGWTFCTVYYMYVHIYEYYMYNSQAKYHRS